MLQRVLATLLCLLGIAAIGLGVASATLWRPSDALAASAEAAPGTTMLMTEPGVLSMAADEVAIRATAEPGTTIVLAIAPSADVEAWIGPDPVTRVTGLVDLDTLSTRDVAGQAPTATPGATASPTPSPTATPGAPGAAPDQPSEAPDPTGSDLWTHEVSGTGQVELDWTRADGRWSLLVASTGQDAAPPSLTLTWPQVVTTPWLVPGVAAGVGLLLLGLTWWAVIAVRARRSARRRRAAESGEQAVATGATSGPPPASGASAPAMGSTTAPQPAAPPPGAGASATGAPVTGEPASAAPLTRRQLRELEQSRAGTRDRDATRAAFPHRISGPQVDRGPTADQAATAGRETGHPGGTARVGPPPGTTHAPADGRGGQEQRDDRPGRGAWLGRLHRPTRRGDAEPPPAEPPAGEPDAVAVAEPPAVSTGPSGDAWRRAWGFPSQAPDQTQDQTPDGGGR